MAEDEAAAVGAPRRPPTAFALAAAPRPVLAQVGGTMIEELQQRLARAGYAARDADASVAPCVGGDTRAQIRVLATVLKPAGG